MNRDEKNFLDQYDETKYKGLSVTNDIIIFTTEDKKENNTRKMPRKGMQVLLVKRDDYPHKGKWAIPGGFVQYKEGLLEGALRKLEEETSVSDVYIEQLYTFGDIGRDERTRVISVGNLALTSKENLKIKNDKSNIKWFWIEKKLKKTWVSDAEIYRSFILSIESEDEEVKIKYEIIEKTEKSFLRKVTKEYKTVEESEELAFDHYKILDYGVDRIRNKIEYTPIAFNLLPRLFTVKELQYVYEAIMGTEILNFRRKMSDMIVETDEVIEGKPYRPAQIFRFNENWEHSF